MRKFISFMLLASAAAAPALAAPADRAEREQARAERQQARDDADDNRPARRPQVSQPQAEARVVEPRQRMVEAPVRAPVADRAGPAEYQAIREARRDSPAAARDWRQDPRRQAIAPIVQRPDRAIMRDRMEQRREEARARIESHGHVRPPVISTVPRPGTQPPPPAVQRPISQAHWNNNWRHDHRYNWNDYRRRHHSLFNLGFYFDPFGWGYQRYDIGWRMWPSYYGSQYWLNDPWQYRLPYAPAGYRWVRYWDDAVLVDTWSGQVVDVIYSFFW